MNDARCRTGTCCIKQRSWYLRVSQKMLSCYSYVRCCWGKKHPSRNDAEFCSFASYTWDWFLPPFSHSSWTTLDQINRLLPPFFQQQISYNIYMKYSMLAARLLFLLSVTTFHLSPYSACCAWFIAACIIGGRVNVETAFSIFLSVLGLTVYRQFSWKGGFGTFVPTRTPTCRYLARLIGWSTHFLLLFDQTLCMLQVG